jgi:hypothetical protein
MIALAFLEKRSKFTGETPRLASVIAMQEDYYA